MWITVSIPGRGYFVEMAVESGFKDVEGQVVRGDTLSEQRRLRQGRLKAQGRLYIPVIGRQVLVTGGEAKLMYANEFDESDLFRFGGATSLRGYDEERFAHRCYTFSDGVSILV